MTREEVQKEEIAEKHAAVVSLAGKSIVAARYYDRNTGDWGPHGTYEITLDDGRALLFYSTGYDASDVWMEEVKEA
jgi:hypothetical protein